MKANITLGLDGFFALFFQEFWLDVKKELIDIMIEFCLGCLDIQKFNYAYVILLPKNVNASSVSNFKLISLLNVSYKIITRALSSRLNIVLNSLLDRAQFGFIDGVAAAQKVISMGSTKKK